MSEPTKCPKCGTIVGFVESGLFMLRWWELDGTLHTDLRCAELQLTQRETTIAVLQQELDAEKESARRLYRHVRQAQDRADSREYANEVNGHLREIAARAQGEAEFQKARAERAEKDLAQLIRELKAAGVLQDVGETVDEIIKVARASEPQEPQEPKPEGHACEGRGDSHADD